LKDLLVSERRSVATHNVRERIERASLETGKPVLCDLFCGGGGATCGYQRAGFFVIGVDISPQPRYCGDLFIQGDALDFIQQNHPGISIYAASPPCQGYSATHTLPWNRSKFYPDLLPLTREKLIESGIPFVIENVVGAPMRVDVMLCGTMFGLRVLRHRWFEISVPVPILTPPCAHNGSVKNGDYVCAVGTGARNSVKHGAVAPYATKSQIQAAMGIDWMTRKEMVQAVPPAYTEFNGNHIRIYRQLTIDFKGKKA